MINNISKIHPWEHWKKWGYPPFQWISPMVAKYGFSDHAENSFKTLTPSKISLWLILLSEIDSIFLMVREIWGCQNGDSHYCITIFANSITLDPFISETIRNMKSVMERKIILSKISNMIGILDFLLCMIWKSIFCQHSKTILFFFFGNYLVTTMILMTMPPSIQKNVYYPFVVLNAIIREWKLYWRVNDIS